MKQSKKVQETKIDYDAISSIFKEDIAENLTSVNPREAIEKVDIPIDPKLDDTLAFFEDYAKKLVEPQGWYKRWIFRRGVKELQKNIQVLKTEVENVRAQSKILDSKALITAEYNLFKLKSWYDIKGYYNRYRLMSGKTKNMFINMELRNGKFTCLLVALNFPYFDYEGGRYIIDDNYKYFNTVLNLWCLDYHQDCCIPIKRKFNVLNVVKSIEESGILDSETSVNPNSLKQFMESDIIQKVISGATIEQWFQFVKLMLIIIMIAVGILLFINGKVLYGN